MKLKLSNSDSRRKIEQLNQRIKILTEDIHTPIIKSSLYYHTEPVNAYFVINQNISHHNNYQQEQQHVITKQKKITVNKKKNYFKSATNLYMNNQQQIYEVQCPQQQQKIIQQGWEKCGKIRNEYNIPRDTEDNLDRSRNCDYERNISGKQKLVNQRRLKKQLTEIMQSKRHFHQLIKKELNHLQRIEDKQPDDDNVGIIDEQSNRRKRVADTEQCIGLQLVGGVGKSGCDKRVISGENGVGQLQEEEVIQVGQKLKDSCKSRQRVSDQQSVQNTNIRQLQMGNQEYRRIKQTSEHELSQRGDNCSLQQDGGDNEVQFSSQVNSVEDIQQYQQSCEFEQRRRQVQSLLKSMMVVDYSESNILSLLKLVEESQSVIKPDQSYLNHEHPSPSLLKHSKQQLSPHLKNSPSPSQSSSFDQKNTPQSSSHSHTYQSINHHLSQQSDHIKQYRQQQEEAKHNRLIYSYKLLELVMKIKHFQRLKSYLVKNHGKHSSLSKAINFRKIKLELKAFQSLQQHKLTSVEQQRQIYKIKSIYVHNIIKKDALKLMLRNANFKVFNFLSHKVHYQLQLKLKSLFISKLKDNLRFQRLSQSVQNLRQKTLKQQFFQFSKQKHQQKKQLQHKKSLLTNIHSHKLFLQTISLLRYDKLKNIILSKQATKTTSKKMRDLVCCNNQAQNQDRGKDAVKTINQGEAFIVSANINTYIVDRLNEYSEMMMSSKAAEGNSIGESITMRQSGKQQGGRVDQVVARYHQALVLSIKSQAVTLYLRYRKAFWFMNSFSASYDKDSRRQLKQTKDEQVQKMHQTRNSVILCKRKSQFIKKLQNNYCKARIVDRVSYFCNTTMGRVPEGLVAGEGQESQFSSSQMCESGERSVQLNVCDNQFVEEQNIQTQNKRLMPLKYQNQLLIKYYKYHFISNLHKNHKKCKQNQLQKYVYFRTIYGNRLLKRVIGQWKAITEQEKLIRRRQEEQKERQQRKIIEEKLIKQQYQRKMSEERERLRQKQQQIMQLQQLNKKQQRQLQEKQLKRKQHQENALKMIKEKQLKLIEKQQQLLKHQNDMIQKVERIRQQYGKLKMLQEKQKLMKDQQEQLDMVRKQVEMQRLRLQRERDELQGMKQQQLQRQRQIMDDMRQNNQKVVTRTKNTVYEVLTENNQDKQKPDMRVEYGSSNKEQLKIGDDELKLKINNKQSEENMDEQQQQYSDHEEDSVNEYSQNDDVNDESELSLNAELRSNLLTKRLSEQEQLSRSRGEGGGFQLQQQQQEKQKDTQEKINYDQKQGYQKCQEGDSCLGQAQEWNQNKLQGQIQMRVIWTQPKNTLNQESIIKYSQYREVKSERRYGDQQEQSIQYDNQGNYEQNRMERFDNNDNDDDNHNDNSQESDQILANYMNRRAAKDIKQQQQQEQQQNGVVDDKSGDQQQNREDMIDWLGGKLKQKELNDSKGQGKNCNDNGVKEQEELRQVPTAHDKMMMNPAQSKIQQSPSLFDIMSTPNNYHLQSTRPPHRYDGYKEADDNNHNQNRYENQQQNDYQFFKQASVESQKQQTKQQDSQSQQQQSSQDQDQQSSLQQQNQSEFSSSTYSPESKRMFLYAVNHHQVYVKRQIFVQVFKLKCYRHRLNEDNKLLQKVFTGWKVYHQQKHQLKRYLGIYETISNKLNSAQFDNEKTRNNQKHTTRSLQKPHISRNETTRSFINENENRPKSQLKNNVKYQQKESKKAHQQLKVQQQNKAKYFPTSKQDVIKYNSITSFQLNKN